MFPYLRSICEELSRLVAPHHTRHFSFFSRLPAIQRWVFLQLCVSFFLSTRSVGKAVCSWLLLEIGKRSPEHKPQTTSPSAICPSVGYLPPIRSLDLVSYQQYFLKILLDICAQLCIMRIGHQHYTMKL